MEEIKLQKYFTDCGVMSRRAAENEIKLGRVLVNGEVAELGRRIDPERDVVTYLGKRIERRESEALYIMLNKPRGYVTTMSDEKGRHTVRDLTGDVGARVYPVGRLDMDSDGLLLMTSDGELANKLTHPRHEIPKIYHVTVTPPPSPDVLIALGEPMVLDGYEILPVKVELISKKEGESTLRMTLYEGRNRQIRKMCEAVGLKVKRLSRVAVGHIMLRDLPVGKWRHLTPDEVAYLKGEEAALKFKSYNTIKSEDI